MQIVRLKVLFAALAALLTLAWAASAPVASLTGGFWAARGVLIPLTGILAIGFMSVAVLLAARPVQIESALGGLDKFYRLHKWLGIGGASLAVVHWLLEVGPRWMVGWGWIARPQRAPRPPAEAAAGFNPFREWRDLAGELGEWGLYLMVALVFLALWKRFPYHLFFKTHRLMAPLFLVLVFHGVILMPQAYWTAPAGPLTAVLMALATVAAGASLFRRIGHDRKAVGRVADLYRYLGNAVLDVDVRMETVWPGHRAGQFAFLDFDDAEGAHPFTISSGWRADGRLVFSIKGLGDYTTKLPELLRVGQAVTVEGPYGRFDFRASGRPQVWIAGGVGVTPFIARLQAMTDAGEAQRATLIYSTAAPDDGFIDQIRVLAERAGVPFHVLRSEVDGLLTLDRLAAWAPDWRDADIWFCGPQGFGRSLRGAMVAGGLPADRFHQELFDLR